MTTAHPHRAPAASEPAADRATFDDLFAAEYGAIVRLAHLLTGSNAAAEDLAQDAFARVIPHHDRLDNPAAYLRTTTVNLCRNWHRTRERELERFRRHGPSPVDEQAELTPRSVELLAAIRHLSYRQQAVLVLRYWLDLSEADIAATLCCRPGTVKSLHVRAIDAVRRIIEPDTTEELP